MNDNDYEDEDEYDDDEDDYRDSNAEQFPIEYELNVLLDKCSTLPIGGSCTSDVCRVVFHRYADEWLVLPKKPTDILQLGIYVPSFKEIAELITKNRATIYRPVEPVLKIDNVAERTQQ